MSKSPEILRIRSEDRSLIPSSHPVGGLEKPGEGPGRIPERSTSTKRPRLARESTYTSPRELRASLILPAPILAASVALPTHYARGLLAGQHSACHPLGRGNFLDPLSSSPERPPPTPSRCRRRRLCAGVALDPHRSAREACACASPALVPRRCARPFLSSAARLRPSLTSPQKTSKAA
eukprot:scaffold492_cov257-Pinguiococcus_pyrenoidosus.AAC.5